MSWFYDDGLSTDKDKVRLLIGDTEDSDQLLSDEAIDWHLTAEAGLYRAAAAAAEAIAATFARRTRRVLGAYSVNSEQKYQQYIALAKALRARALTTAGGAGAFAGGISQTQKTTTEADGDRAAPTFSRRLFDVPGNTVPTPHTQEGWP